MIAMGIREILTKVRQSDSFRNWEKQNPDAYLVHFFFMEGEKAPWHVGYYDKGRKEMTSFILEGEEVKVQPEKDVFKDEKEAIRPVVVDEVKKDFDEIRKASEDYQKENYPAEYPLRKMYILQNLRDFGHVWNITMFSKSFRTLNMKFDAITGELKSHELANLFKFDDGKDAGKGNGEGNGRDASQSGSD
jgi:hypothetical protein